VRHEPVKAHRIGLVDRTGEGASDDCFMKEGFHEDEMEIRLHLGDHDLARLNAGVTQDTGNALGLLVELCEREVTVLG